MLTTTPSTATPPRNRATWRLVTISAWATPVLIVGQFAMVAVVPVALVLIGVLRDTRLRALRWWAAALAVAYAIPLALWAIGPHRAPSLSKDMNPIFAVLIVGTAIATAIASHLLRRKSRPTVQE
ncbi:hypothetical protein GCM10010174_68490 [Kutzneria viridogrisea]|uniref:Uncharacterized protein n=2 Tax=Kutzneria TaxID=43356 RepID=W5WE14_9PSEU|nr:hypothetical protein [Kutzneria albida]AHH99087.1 hypothetical protein KALB_5726 [Kutzneria albida DSM 43870]MBA8923358.1 hypothetical protein [Kutzneria viridogrisea]